MDSIEQQNHDWSNYWNGRTASETGEVFGLIEVETNDDLASFWRSVFEDYPANKVIDLACGAGSVLQHVGDPNTKELIGVDISQAAIDIAVANVSGLRGIVASATNVPLASQSADLVVSQFGFEYAGKDCASEIARLLKPGGMFIAVAHMKNSAIEQECKSRLAGLVKIEDSKFVERAKVMIAQIIAFERGQSNQSREDLTPLIDDFSEAQTTLVSLAETNRIATHLYTGTKQLFERRTSYEYKDIEGWLDGMQLEVSAYRGRMESMINAALTESEALELLNTIGVDEDCHMAPFKMDSDIVGWILKAKRSAV